MLNMMAAAATGNGEVSVPPGFRFHPTDEELLYYYLRKKVAYEPIDLDVIREVDLNKLEPWDLKDKCRIGTGPQNEWYFFSHKDRKYPTGTRTNRATIAGFWKATGRDKAIHLSNAKRIGMRKTLVFYIGRAPNGQKTDWIMHEYRLNEDNTSDQAQEDGWVVCRVYKKKNHQMEQLHPGAPVMEETHVNCHMKARGPSAMEQNSQSFQIPWDCTLDNSMHLPQLLSSEPTTAFTPHFNPSSSLNLSDVECPQNLTKLMGGGGDGSGGGLALQHEMRFGGDWSILDKLLASHQSLDQLLHGKGGFQSQFMNGGGGGGAAAAAVMHKLPLQYLGCEGDMLKFLPK